MNTGNKCDKCRMWAYVHWNKESGYLCFEKMCWLIREPNGEPGDKGFVSAFMKGLKCKEFIKC